MSKSTTSRIAPGNSTRVFHANFGGGTAALYAPGAGSCDSRASVRKSPDGRSLSVMSSRSLKTRFADHRRNAPTAKRPKPSADEKSPRDQSGNEMESVEQPQSRSHGR